MDPSRAALACSLVSGKRAGTTLGLRVLAAKLHKRTGDASISSSCEKSNFRVAPKQYVADDIESRAKAMRGNMANSLQHVLSVLPLLIP
eukprot:scaffold951_cov146-Amphora_coffeaeformis.AAC.5